MTRFRMSRARPWLRLAGLALLTILVILGSYFAGRHDSGSGKSDGGKGSSKSAAAPPPPSGPPSVTLTPPQIQYAELEIGTAQAVTLPTKLSALGTVVPNQNGMAQVSSRLAGKVVRVPVNVGQTVQAGDPLLIISSLELDQAQAVYHDSLLRQQAAAATLARVVRLGQLGEFGRPALMTARINFQQSQGEVQTDKDAVRVQEAQVLTADAQVNLTQKQYARAQLLYQSQLVSRQDLEQFEANALQAKAALGQTITARKAAEDRLQNAQKRNAIASRELTRQTAIYNGGLLTAAQVTPARQAYQLAAHEVEAAVKQLELMGGATIDEATPAGGLLTIKAPIAGKVSARMVSVGESVTPDKPLLTILNAKTVIVQLHVYQEDAAHLRAGQTVSITANVASGRTYSGTISAVGSELDMTTRTLPVYCLIRNPDGALKPGVYVSGTIYGAARANTVAVPQLAVQRTDGGPAVFVPGGKPGEFVAQPVKTGETVNGVTQITQGLQDGQSIVTKNAFVLKSQMIKDTLN